jgi:beta-N-acetylhexosaminidase
LPRSRFWIPVTTAVIAIALAVALAVTAAAGYFPFARHGVAGAAAAAFGNGSPGADQRAAADPAAGRPPGSGLPALTPAQMAGQRVIYSYPSITPPPQLLDLISHGEVGGVIFFSQNISSTAQITSVIAQLEQADASPQNPVRAPLLLMTDQEGGMIRRMPGAPLLSARQIGESADPAAAAAQAGSSAGQNLRSVGMNVNLAPVLDVYRSPDDFDDQFQRSYSMDPDVVAQLGAAFITAQQAQGVAATAKHFPGLGAAAQQQDTDKAPVTLNLPLATIRNVDELPYQAAIAAGARIVMVSWAVYPALDPTRPAGLSSHIVGGELRQRLGFTGVTMTDALEADALRAYGSYGNRGLLAAQAGMDLILCSAKNVTEGQQAAAGLEQGYHDGQLSKAAFTAALQRVIALRASLAG